MISKQNEALTFDFRFLYVDVSGSSSWLLENLNHRTESRSHTPRSRDRRKRFSALVTLAWWHHPFPIPNTEVKRCSPDGSTAKGRCESRTSPEQNPGELTHRGFCFLASATRAERPEDWEPPDRRSSRRG